MTKNSLDSNTVTSTNLDKLFTFNLSRADRWREFISQITLWSEGRVSKDELKNEFEIIKKLELLHAYPGNKLLSALSYLFENDDKVSFLNLAKRVSYSIMSESYKKSIFEWSTEYSDFISNESENVELSFDLSSKPYFELLVVAPNTPNTERNVQLLRNQRRDSDDFYYEIITVNSFEDAICAVAANGNICSVALYDGFNFKSSTEMSVLSQLLENIGIEEDDDILVLKLIKSINNFRPELDIFLMSDRDPEIIASDVRANNVKRILYAIEEPMELHLSILEGVRYKYNTPFFDNLKNYAKKPISTFHALPIARGKSVFKSDWIKDMGEFYGTNLFLAESSATTGGLDSLLEPTGNIKKAQELAAEAFGAEHCHFITNGTSTSNKIVLMAIAKPGDIIIIDRNCHKSHHYAMVLGGLSPYYIEAYPLKEYSMYGAVPIIEIKKALLKLKSENKLDRVKVIDLTNCTFDGHVYNVRRVMMECLAIKPDLVFLWDEAWFGFAHWSPFLRPRTAMGAASHIEDWLKTPEALDEFKQQQNELGNEPSDEKLLSTQLIPDPRLVKLRVYQTHSTHKSMSSLRQGSMILAKDVYYNNIKYQLNEAIFTHSTTSPNQQIIASLDIARRQMVLEGYQLVSNAIQIALNIRYNINNHPLISKYFKILGADDLIPAEYRKSGFVDFLSSNQNLISSYLSLANDEFFLDPTRLTLVCGTANFDGTSFKNLLADKFEIQVNKTSRNSVLLQSNINNTRSDVAHLLKVLINISKEIENALLDDSKKTRFKHNVAELMENVPDLPNFSHFAEEFREDVNGNISVEGDIRTAFFKSWDESNCEYIDILSPECDERLANGPEMVSAKLVIPYPPGFPILVPGQVIDKHTIEFMRKLDVKEIHGYDNDLGLQLIISK